MEKPLAETGPGSGNHLLQPGPFGGEAMLLSWKRVAYPTLPWSVDHVGVNVPEQRLDHSSALLPMTTKSWEQLATNDIQDLIPDTILLFTWENASVQATHMVHF